MRVRSGQARARAKKRLFKEVRGNRAGRGNLLRTVKETLVRSRAFAFRDRRVRKRNFRALWITRITAAVRSRGLSYSNFIHGLTVAGVGLNRKTLSELAISDPQIFDEIVDVAKSAAASAAPREIGRRLTIAIMDLPTALSQYQSAAVSAIDSAATAEQLEAVRIEFLGKKKGRLRDLQALLSQAPVEGRPQLGKVFNAAKDAVETALKQRAADLSRPAQTALGLDITLPGERPSLGGRHPLTQTIEEFKDIIGRFGFNVADGPEIEDEYHNFVALNIPDEHPARDPLDNFYLATAAATAGKADGDNANSPVLLRSQTSTVQIRSMETMQPPVCIASVGRVYRPDTIDATHSCMFHQMEGLMVGPGVTMAMLKTVLRLFATAYLGHSVHIRFRPSFFPFTEPSVEVDLNWEHGWLEIGGAGMVDPHVLTAVGYDPEEVTGFAFGLGIERFCMRRHQITDIRRFYENDVRFLQQF